MVRTIAREFSRGGQPIAAFPGIARAYLEDVRYRRRDVITEAATIEELARKLGIANLPETVGRWNVAVMKGSDDEFGREALGAGIKEGPFARRQTSRWSACGGFSRAGRIAVEARRPAHRMGAHLRTPRRPLRGACQA